jgi:flagellar biosynthesis protein FlhB
MLSWMLQTTIISVVLIFLVHHLIQFFRDTLTTPKIKDLVNTPPLKYEHMFSAMTSSTAPVIHTIDIQNLLPKTTHNATPIETNSINSSSSSIDSLSMKNELKNYLKNQSFATPINSLDSNYTPVPKKIKITELV